MCKEDKWAAIIFTCTWTKINRQMCKEDKWAAIIFTSTSDQYNFYDQMEDFKINYEQN